MGCIWGPGGWGLGFLGCVRGACAGYWAGLACRGVWGSLRWVFAGGRVWGVGWGVRQVGPWRVCAVVWAAEGGPCRGARGCARWWACVGRRLGSKGGGAVAEILRGAVLCRCMCRLAAAHLCGEL